MDETFNPYAAPQSNVIPAPVPGNALPSASRWHRFLATLLDTLIIMVVVTPLEWLTGTFDRTMQASQAGSIYQAESIFWSFVGFGVMLLFNWSHLLEGQTIGKRVLKLKMVRKDGSPCDRNRLILWRMLPLQVVIFIPVIGAIIALADCFSIFRSSRYMLHDDVADTKVVDLRPQLAGG